MAFIIIALSVWIISSIVLWSIWNGISPTPSSIRAKECILSNLPDTVKGAVYELGAGWGTLAFPLAAKYPDNQVIAIELSPIPYLVCRLRAAIRPLPNLTVVRKNFYHMDLSQAGLVTCYLYPGAMQRLAPKFCAELPDGAMIVSNTFAIRDFTPIKTVILNDLYQTKIYFYQMRSL